jgi:hypothetical protein
MKRVFIKIYLSIAFKPDKVAHRSWVSDARSSAIRTLASVIGPEGNGKYMDEMFDACLVRKRA